MNANTPLVELPPIDAPSAPPPDFERRCADELGVEFEPGDLERLGTYVALVLALNARVNVTAAKEPEDFWNRHIFDAMTLVGLVAGEIPAGGSVVDLGSGGGLPALPLAIVLPQLHFTLVDATGKKAKALELLIERLGLENARAVHQRLERFGSQGSRARGAFDAATCRALGHLAIVAELAVPLVRFSEGGGGLVFAVKGAKADEEVVHSAEALRRLRARHAETIPTPTGRIVVLEKVGPTAPTYPRRDGEPKRAPLGID